MDTALPFGWCLAPKIFTSIADALEWIIKNKGAEWLRHYLDGSSWFRPLQKDLEISLEVCSEAGVLVAEEKTMGPATLMQLLGVELDSEKMEVRLPEKQLTKLKEIVASWRRRK